MTCASHRHTALGRRLRPSHGEARSFENLAPRRRHSWSKLAVSCMVCPIAGPQEHTLLYLPRITYTMACALSYHEDRLIPGTWSGTEER
ncbi:hypothetical protein PYCCODRAFT_210813 [Trametes coccinea BRFM310]|uniref:Uncharacterized protein n=1 Tax=Trametes coccinea (strain BRFM310) TaxID=1353009 RepID=A0A1Y2IQK0_TRAC3|nr:hypothetical protein PYCCODRAFT_210813 [Trametes coccinea BRFM310]